MDKSRFFSALFGHIKANRIFYLIVALLILAGGGYFWWQSGFTLDVSRFFANQSPSVCGDGFCDIDEQNTCSADCAGGSSGPTSALDPTVAINNALPIRHGEQLSVSWSATGANTCTASSWIDTNARFEG